MRVVAATRRLTREWLATAEPVALSGITRAAVAVASPFPVVAIVGFRRPTLVIARSVLAACSPEELRRFSRTNRGTSIGATTCAA